MGKAIPTQHPAVVLRSHFRAMRALLAAALIAVVGLTVAVVILANDRDEVASTSTAEPVESLNYGGFNPATGRPESAPLPGGAPKGAGGGLGGPPPVGSSPFAASPLTSRYDGGPEEGSRGSGR